MSQLTTGDPCASSRPPGICDRKGCKTAASPSGPLRGPPGTGEPARVHPALCIPLAACHETDCCDLPGSAVWGGAVFEFRTLGHGSAGCRRDWCLSVLLSAGGRMLYIYMIVTTEGLGHPRPGQASAACSDQVRGVWNSKKEQAATAALPSGRAGGDGCSLGPVVPCSGRRRG